METPFRFPVRALQAERRLEIVNTCDDRGGLEAGVTGSAGGLYHHHSGRG
jgi:hypothetical protein